jgi:hypothetical protein
VEDEGLDYAGMTTNERLVVAGLLEKFDNAVRRGDRAKMIELLEAVDVLEAPAISDVVLNHPTRYGRMRQL